MNISELEHIKQILLKDLVSNTNEAEDAQTAICLSKIEGEIVRKKQNKPLKIEKIKCPNCGSIEIIMFTADLDICKKCKSQI